MTKEEYKQKFLDVIDYFKTSIIEPNTGSSAIKTRFIAPNGVNDEQWIGSLRSLSGGSVDVWLISLSALKSLRDEEKQVGGSVKPFTITLDYLYDYRQGTDADNSETSFREKLFFIDYALEKVGGKICSLSGVRIIDWDFKLRLKRFTNDTSHWAVGVINLEMDIQNFN